MENSLLPMFEELNSIQKTLIKEVFNDLIVPVPIIVAEYRPTVYGYIYKEKVLNINGNPTYSIHLNILNFKERGVYGIISTLWHELVHLYNLTYGVFDVGSNQRHNKKFKDACTKFKLNCEKTTHRGWSSTELSDYGYEFVKKLDVKHLNAYIDFQTQLTNGTKKKKVTYKYQCPSCQSSFRATSELDVKCNDCYIDYELVN